MKNFIKGFLLASIGMTIVNSICDIISVLTELLKSAVGCKIVSYNNKIEASNVRVIGFQTNNEEGEDNED